MEPQKVLWRPCRHEVKFFSLFGIGAGKVKEITFYQLEPQPGASLSNIPVINKAVKRSKMKRVPTSLTLILINLYIRWFCLFNQNVAKCCHFPMAEKLNELGSSSQFAWKFICLFALDYTNASWSYNNMFSLLTLTKLILLHILWDALRDVIQLLKEALLHGCVHVF